MELKDLSNIFIPIPDNDFGSNWKPKVRFKKLTLEDILSMTIVYYKDSFQTQWNDETGNEAKKKVIFYIQKYRKTFTYDELCSFIAEHSEENFLLCDDCEGRNDFIRVYYETYDGKIKLYFIANLYGQGNYKILATVSNKKDTVEWDSFKILDDKILQIELTNNYYYGKNYNRHVLTIATQKNLIEVSGFHVFNEKGTNRSNLDSTQILNAFLKIKNKTRILSEYEGSSDIYFKVSVEPKALLSINERYGITKYTGYSYYCNEFLHSEDLFPTAKLDEKTWNRISEYINDCLNNNQGESHTTDNWAYLRKDMLVITEPVGSHRRPTYHLISGFKACGSIDIVELARGELLMKDMTPVSVYYLLPTGEYGRLSHNLLGTIRSYIIEKAEIDRVSFAQWTEQKSLHPELMQAFAKYVPEGKIDLKQIKIFNRIPFGALFIEQLIKGGMFNLAMSFGVYISTRADNMNYICGSLQDILPDCNPEGSSLIKTLCLQKPCFDLLMELCGETVDSFATNYIAMKKICIDGVLTKDKKKLLQEYKELQQIGWSSLHCGTGRTIDLIDYPEETKMVYKMINKIKNTFVDDRGNQQYEALRHYNEIMTAYFKFVDLEWNPSDYMIFLEFSLNGELGAVMKMLQDRERAATTALSIYQNKIDEILREKTETKYKNRLKNILKLCNITSLSKKKESYFNKKYTIVAPSGIYDTEKTNSIEKEGKDMNHCVFRVYAEKIANGTYTVVYLRNKSKPEESLVTIGITDKGRINQTYTFNDSAITEEQAQAIIEWAKSKKGLVTFRSETVSVQPGGWPSKVEVPTLPEPDADWLKKLANIE